MAKNEFDEYGGEIDLQKTLEDLAFYCITNLAKGPITVILPRKAVETFLSSLQKKQPEKVLTSHERCVRVNTAESIIQIYSNDEVVVLNGKEKEDAREG